MPRLGFCLGLGLTLAAGAAGCKDADSPGASGKTVKKRGAKLSAIEKGLKRDFPKIKRTKRRTAVGYVFSHRDATLYDADVKASLEVVANVAPDMIGQAALPELTKRFKKAGCDLDSLATVRPDKRGRSFVENCKPGGTTLMEPAGVFGVSTEFVVIAAAMIHNAREHGFEDSPAHKRAVAEILAIPDVGFDGPTTLVRGRVTDRASVEPTVLSGDGPIWLFVERSSYAKLVDAGRVTDSLNKIAAGRQLVFRAGGRYRQDIRATWGHPEPLPKGRVEVRVGLKTTEIVASNEAEDEHVSGTVAATGEAYTPAVYGKLAALRNNLSEVIHLVVVPGPGVSAQRMLATLEAAQWRMEEDSYAGEKEWLRAREKEVRDGRVKVPLYPKLFVAAEQSKLEAAPKMPGALPTGKPASAVAAPKAMSNPDTRDEAFADDKTVIIDKISVDGGLKTDVVKRFVRRNLSALRSCYYKTLKVDPTAAGKMTIEFGVAPSGRVIAAVLESRTLRFRALDACLAYKVERWRLPAPTDGEEAEVKFSIVLKTR